MDIPFIPVCGYCFADLEVLERDNNGNIISWICPECGEIEYAMEKLQNIINENIEWFWKNDPCLEHESNVNELWKYFKLWCVPNCKENFEDMDESIIEETVNASYDTWKNWNSTL